MIRRSGQDDDPGMCDREEKKRASVVMSDFIDEVGVDTASIGIVTGIGRPSEERRQFLAHPQRGCRIKIQGEWCLWRKSEDLENLPRSLI